MAERASLAIDYYEQPKMAELAVSDSQAKILGKAVCTIVLGTGVSGSVTVRNTPVLVLEEKMEEVLLGDDLLNRLGFNVRKQLAYCQPLYDYNRGRIVDDDPTTEVSAFPSMGGNDPQLIIGTLKMKVEEALANGLDESQKDLWMDLVSKRNNTEAGTLGYSSRWLPLYNRAHRRRG